MSQHWDEPVFAEHQEMRSNRVDACIFNHKGKEVHHTRDELSMGQQQREEERGEDPQVCPPALGIETAVPRLRGATAQHHHRCPWGVVTGDEHYDSRDRKEQE